MTPLIICRVLDQRSARLPQQLALTVFRNQVSACVKVILETKSQRSHLKLKLTRETTPKRSTYGSNKHQCVCLRWSPCDQLASLAFICKLRSICHSQPSQQEALPEFKEQVVTYVGPKAQTVYQTSFFHQLLHGPEQVVFHVVSPLQSKFSKEICPSLC